MILPSLVAFLRPYLIQIVTAGVLILTAMSMILVYGHSRYRAGPEAERTRIEQQNQKAKSNADRAARTPDECNDAGGMWDQLGGKCLRP